MFCVRKVFSELDDLQQVREQRVIAVSAVEAMVSIGPTCGHAHRAQLGQFDLNGTKSKPLMIISSRT